MSEHLSRSTRSPDIVDATNTTRLIKKIEEKEAIVEYLQNRVLTLQNRFGAAQLLGGFDELVEDIRSSIELRKQLESQHRRVEALEKDNAALRKELRIMQQGYESDLRRADEERTKLEHLVAEQEETLCYLNSLVQSYEGQLCRDGPSASGSAWVEDDREDDGEPRTPALEVLNRSDIMANKWGTEIVAPSPHSVEALYDTPASAEDKASPVRRTSTSGRSEGSVVIEEDASSPELTSVEQPSDSRVNASAESAYMVTKESLSLEASREVIDTTTSICVSRDQPVGSPHWSGWEPPRYRQHRDVHTTRPSVTLATTFYPSLSFDAISLRPVLASQSSSLSRQSSLPCCTAEPPSETATATEANGAVTTPVAPPQATASCCGDSQAADGDVVAAHGRGIAMTSQESRLAGLEVNDGSAQSSPLVPKLQLQTISAPTTSPLKAPFRVDSAALDCPGAEVKEASGGVMLTFPTSDIASKTKRSPRLDLRFSHPSRRVEGILTARPVKHGGSTEGARLQFAPPSRKTKCIPMTHPLDGPLTDSSASTEAHSKLAAARDTLKRSRQLEASSALLHTRLDHLVPDTCDHSSARPQTSRPHRRTNPRYGLSKSLGYDGAPKTARNTNCSVSAPVPEAADIVDESLRMYLSNPASPQARYEFQKVSKGVYKYGTKRLVVAMKNDKPMVRIGGGSMHLGSFLKAEEKLRSRADHRQLGGRIQPHTARQRVV